jgi:RND family efflux transporter MFP subunit
MAKPKRTLISAAIFLAILAGCRKPNQLVTPPPPIVTVAHPIEKNVADSIEFVGTTEPTQVVVLRARVNGYLEKILFKDGSDVESGQELFLIEQAPYQSALDAAKAALQKAVASLGLARSQYRRMEPLLKDGVVTQEELDVQKAQVATSEADVAAAQAAVRKAELDLGYTKITAPISGRIARHMVDVGNLVRAEDTELAIIRVIDPIYAIFDVSENDLLRFMAMRRNDELPDPDKNPPIIRLGLANEDGFPHVGRLDYREMILGSQTGTARRRAIFPNSDWQLIPGMQVRIHADIGAPKPRLLIDERAIGSDQRGDFLLVVNDKNTVEYRPVRLGIHVGTKRVIESGVAANDRVIVNGLQRARAGATVNPQPAESVADSAPTPAETNAKATPSNNGKPEPIADASADSSKTASPTASPHGSGDRTNTATDAVSAATPTKSSDMPQPPDSKLRK